MVCRVDVKELEVDVDSDAKAEWSLRVCTTNESVFTYYFIYIYSFHSVDGMIASSASFIVAQNAPHSGHNVVRCD